MGIETIICGLNGAGKSIMANNINRINKNAEAEFKGL